MTYVLEPEFIVDHQGRIHHGVVLIDENQPPKILDSAPPSVNRIKLHNKMLLPGFVNVHSHAVQRALRGRVEQRSEGGQDNFWSWRTLMYRDANKVGLDDLEAIASLAYLEMLEAGFVAVGEFHYLHHDASGKHFSDPTSTSQRLAKAADRVGIRLTLLTCAYERKNHREALLKEQRRFGFANATKFLAFAAEVRKAVHSPLLNHGLAIHSTRACSKSWIEEISYSLLAAEGPLHAHASEQKQEVEESFLEHGLSPIDAFKNFGMLRENATLIHGTHLSRSDVDTLARAKALVGLCPSTERNLGDGMCPIEDLRTHNVGLCIGTDQHVRLDPVSELRDIEEQERLRLRRRCIVAEPGHTVGESLIPIGTINGRRSLGLDLNAPDFVAVELSDAYEAAGPLAALNSYIVAGTHHDVTDVFVDGHGVMRDGAAVADHEAIRREAVAALKRLHAG